MDVSIVVPTLNEEDFIENCLDSLSRTIDRTDDDVDVEVLVVDSHSTDETLSLVRSHRLDCRVVYAETGILSARQAGVKAADGELVVSADADSIYDERYLPALLEPFRKRDDVVLTYGPCYGEQPLHLDASIRLALQFGMPLVGACWVSGANRAFDASAFRAVDGYDLSKDARSVFHVMVEEQVTFPLKMQCEGDVVFVNDAKAVQSSRTLKQLFLVGKKGGGRNWKLIRHYRLVDRLREFIQ